MKSPPLASLPEQDALDEAILDQVVGGVTGLEAQAMQLLGQAQRVGSVLPPTI